MRVDVFKGSYRAFDARDMRWHYTIPHDDASAIARFKELFVCWTPIMEVNGVLQPVTAQDVLGALYFVPANPRLAEMAALACIPAVRATCVRQALYHSRAVGDGEAVRVLEAAAAMGT